MSFTECHRRDLTDRRTMQWGEESEDDTMEGKSRDAIGNGRMMTVGHASSRPDHVIAAKSNSMVAVKHLLN